MNKDQNSVRKAFEDSVGVLGESAKHAMMYELTVHAQVDFDTEPLSAERLYDGLLKLYGKDTADIIMGQVLARLKTARQQL